MKVTIIGAFLISVYTYCISIIVFIFMNFFIFIKNIILFCKNFIVLVFFILKSIFFIFFKILNLSFIRYLISNRKLLLLKYELIITTYIKTTYYAIINEVFLLYKMLTKSIFSLFLFIYNDIAKQLFLWVNRHRIKGFALLLNIFILFFGIFYFTKNSERFFILSDKWNSGIQVAAVSKIFINTIESELFKPMKFYPVSVAVESGQNLYDILITEKIDPKNASDVIKEVNSVYSLKQLKSEIIINMTIVSSREWEYNRIQKLSFPISERKRDLIIEADSNYKYYAYTKETKLTRYIMRRKITIKGSIAESANKLNVPYSIIREVTKTLEWDVDFQREIQDNDVLEIIFECLYNQNDELSSCDNLLYASLKGSSKNIIFYKYKGSYYEEDGKSVAKFLIKTPVDNARRTSSFGFWNHPVLGYNLIHKGVDFAGPVGIPIYASGSGTVEMMQYSPTYGYFLKIRHNPHLQTLYAHMDSFRRNLKVGYRVIH